MPRVSKTSITSVTFFVIGAFIHHEVPLVAAKAKGSHLRVHFKNTREAANAIRHMHLRRAVRFLKNVIAKKEIVPFTRFKGDVGRKAQVFYCPCIITVLKYIQQLLLASIIVLIYSA